MRNVGLDRATVVAAATHLARSVGIENLSMRRLATALDVTPMALYRHLPNKESLLDLVVDESLRSVPPVDPDGPLIPELRNSFGAIYRLAVEQPGLAAAMAARPLEGEVARHLGERVLVLAGRHGFDDNRAAEFLVALFGLTLGTALYRSSRKDRQARLATAGDDTPTVVRLRDAIAGVSARDDQFLDSLDRLAAGYLRELK
ncbi:hypothetical protein MCHIJ_48860 [Mycolicibacterium chitae]|uniref:TetR family transcriptional regulator n=1 Tax=Mycolicibacterium chitae TaxID=1792 RepID=A0A448I9E9_MYCCI|nr:TetR family transcriptional regulator [Mycolicibacterium chitae]BBZ05449.1 hypothetical protein MCHIJ_48860 [Mycolicibacterium chitae]VEG49065.1 TetR family transcriptional regulator [Mycolicibacterium chitae]